MKIENYSFSNKLISQSQNPFHGQIFTYQLFVKDNLNNITYGTTIQINGVPPDNQFIFNYFSNKDNFKHFWIELDIIKIDDSIEKVKTQVTQ